MEIVSIDLENKNSDNFEDLNGEVHVNQMSHKDDFRHILSETSKFTHLLQENLENFVIESLQDLSEATNRDYSKIIEFIKQNNTAKPRFLIFDKDWFSKEKDAKISQSIQEIIERDQDFSNTEIDSLYIVFNLPKPLAHWWNKGIGNWGNQNKNFDVKDEVIGWGSIYRNAMEKVWEGMDRAEELDISRLNDIGEHDSKNYYYIWKIEKFKSKKMELPGPDGEKIKFSVDYSDPQKPSLFGVIDIVFEDGNTGKEILSSARRCPVQTFLPDGSRSYMAHVPSRYMNQVFKACETQGISFDTANENDLCPCHKPSIWGEGAVENKYYDQDTKSWKDT